MQLHFTGMCPRLNGKINRSLTCLMYIALSDCVPPTVCESTGESDSDQTGRRFIQQPAPRTFICLLPDVESWSPFGIGGQGQTGDLHQRA